MTPSIRSISDIRHLQREAREQAVPSAQTAERDTVDIEIQKAMARLSKVIARRTALPPIQDENLMLKFTDCPECGDEMTQNTIGEWCCLSCEGERE